MNGVDEVAVKRIKAEAPTGGTTASTAHRHRATTWAPLPATRLPCGSAWGVMLGWCRAVFGAWPPPLAIKAGE